MTKELVCAYCGKKLQEESSDADEITYIIDPEDGQTVCFDCLHYNGNLSYPTVKFYPSEEEVWISEMFTGTDNFVAVWKPEHKYKGCWEINSKSHVKVETDDVDSTISELKAKGEEFAVLSNNGDVSVWIKK